MMNIKEIINEDAMYKYRGIEPEGFVLVHEKTLEDLKDFEIWKEWKNNYITIKTLNNKNVNLD